MAELSPGIVIIVGALIAPLLRGVARSVWLLLLPLAALVYLVLLPDGSFGRVEFFEMTLVTLRIDALSRVFGYVFLIAAFLGTVYALHLKGPLQPAAAMAYAGSAVGAVFAGDLLTLFIFWEGMTIASVFLIWANGTERAFRAGMRYLIVQIVSGVLLLAGIVILYRETGSIAFGALDVETVAGVLILIAFGIKCAFPFLHSWLQDAYPEATVTGAVMLSAFTTKAAIYALARGYAGTELLVPIGVAMAVFPIFYAVIENDLRRVLAYSLISQLGFMVVGVGIGTELALNGTVAQAFGSVIYTMLLFMVTGAVLHRTGTIRASELGGLYKSMPWTAAFAVIGAASVSAVPLFTGFVTKALILSAAMEQERQITWLLLVFASVGIFHNAGFKVPYFAFFAPGSNRRCDEAPVNMRAAMGLAAILCVGIGLFPSLLYALLPYEVSYSAYTLEHVVTQLQLLAFAALAITLLLRTNRYPSEQRGVNLDADWIYRRVGYGFVQWLYAVAGSARVWSLGLIGRRLTGFLNRLYRHHGPQGVLARTWPTGSMALWATILLAAYLIVYYI